MSVFTPWAPSMTPRLWLFDALYYAWFVLLAWALVEAGLAWRGGRDRSVRGFAWTLALIAIAGIAWIYERTDIGLQMKVQFSDEALRRSASLPYETPRHRAGHFLIDTVREPIAGQPWLWLGRPYGGGTGTQRALVLVRGSGVQGGGAPLNPGGSYGFRHIVGEWWLAEMR